MFEQAILSSARNGLRCSDTIAMKIGENMYMKELRYPRH